MGSEFRFGRDCERIAERLEEYVTGALPEGEERGGIAAHLDECRACREAAASVAQVGRMVGSLSALPIPARPGNWDGVKARLKTTPNAASTPAPKFGFRFWGVGVLAALCGTAAIVLPSPNGPLPTYSQEAARAAADTAPGPKWADKVPLKGDRQDLRGYSTVGTGGNTLTVAPAIFNKPADGTFPVVVEVGNNGPATRARLTIRPFQYTYNTLRQYTYALPLRAQGVSRFLLYPSVGEVVSGEAKVRLRFQLEAPGREQSINLEEPAGGPQTRVVYLGKRFPAVSLKRTARRNGRPFYIPSSMDRATSIGYLLPENAPDQAIGYDKTDVLVLSSDARQLNDIQWRAIKNWVITGGAVLLSDPELLKRPIVAGMSPVSVETSRLGTRLLPRPGTDVRDRLMSSMPNVPNPRLVRRDIGAGTVLYANFALDTEELRDWPGYGVLWDRIHWFRVGLKGHAYFAPKAGFRTEAAYHRLWQNGGGAGDDPFHTAFPRMEPIALYFVAYFLLAAPVTYFVLKRRGRLNNAWVTGPCVALLFSVGLFALTVRLYLLPTARRTKGVVALASGDPQGVFLGTTEFFFPRAGRYTANVSGWESVETRVGPYDPRERPLETVGQAETDRTEIAMDVTNLSFRRLYHRQSVNLNGPIVFHLQPVGGDRYRGFIENRTGQALTDATIVMSGWKAVRWRPNRTNLSGVETDRKPFVGLFQLGTLPVGRTPVDRVFRNPDETRITHDYRELFEGFISDRDYVPMPQFARMTLVARIPGGQFGLPLGKDVDRERNVTVMVNTERVGDTTDAVRQGGHR
ncbi:MAG: zf-HC2 domain-containing protein [Capsulimonadales bacterium]|nr:zf-HC2 domain-containing protein [Capsulimonadales bacterium]